MIKLERGKIPDELTDEVCEELKRLYAEDNDKAVWNKLYAEIANYLVINKNLYMFLVYDCQ